MTCLQTCKQTTAGATLLEQTTAVELLEKTTTAAAATAAINNNFFAAASFNFATANCTTAVLLEQATKQTLATSLGCGGGVYRTDRQSEQHCQCGNPSDNRTIHEIPLEVTGHLVRLAVTTNLSDHNTVPLSSAQAPHFKRHPAKALNSAMGH